MSGENSVLTWLPTLGGLAVKSLLVFLIAGAALFALRRASASARHLVCLLTLAGLLALPALSLALPGWRLAVLAAPRGGGPTPRQVASPPETGWGGVPETGKAGAASSAPAPLVLTSSSSRFGRTPVSGANKEVGPFPWLSFLLSLWLGGALLSLLRPALGLWGIARLSQASRPVLGAPTLALTAECAAALGLAWTPALRQADAPVPMTWGWRRPVVLLPLGAQGWPEGRLRAVLLHELAHVRRRDWLSHRLADAVCALYWFHPLVWLTARRLRAEGEIACDDLVLTSGIAAPDYARHLLDVARALRPFPADVIPQAAVAMARTARIEGRLRMILDHTRPRRALTRRALLLALTPGAAALVALAVLRLEVRAQAAPVGSRPLAALAAPSDIPQAPGTISRYLIGPGPRHPLMRQEGAITWSPPRLASLPRVLPSGAKLRAETMLKPLRAAVPKAAPRVALPSHEAPLAPPAAPALSVTGLQIDGASILAGVTDADKPGGAWWSASGAPLTAPVYDTSAYRAENHADARTHNVSFAVRLPASARGLTVQYEAPQSRGFSSDGFWPTKIQENGGKTEAETFPRTGGVRVLTAAFPASLLKADLWVGFASGAWKVAATYAPTATGYGDSHILLGNSQFLFSPVSETKDGTVQSITTDATDDLRVVAVDAQGRETLPLLIGGNSAGALDQIAARFALPLAQIKEIRVETRPFRWVTFRDVALQPAK